MQEPRGIMSILLSAVWLVLLATAALWIASAVISQVWGWLLLGGVPILLLALFLAWLKWRRDRW